MEPSENSLISDKTLSRIVEIASCSSKTLEELMSSVEGSALIEEVRKDYSAASNRAMFFEQVYLTPFH